MTFSSTFERNLK